MAKFVTEERNISRRNSISNREIGINRVIEQLRMLSGIMENRIIRRRIRDSRYGWRADWSSSVFMDSVVRECLLPRGFCLLGDLSGDRFWSSPGESQKESVRGLSDLVLVR